MPLDVGLSAACDLSVTDADTARAMRSGDVLVLSTPRVVGLAEEAVVAAVAGALPEGTTTVGYRVQIDHLAPVPVGGKVRAEATLTAAEGRRLTFRVLITDGRGLVAAGRITRVVVDTDRFLERAAGS
ncbi:MAG: thioesterase [Acidimicrobiia bacterium]|nr:thioesterase [Acidimicrobiia bacterium]MCL4292858.1 thioesterase [Acidimicrobiia bacterium]